MYAFCWYCPSATFASQHGGFVPCERKTAKGLLGSLINMKENYNARHKSWNTCVIFPFPNVDFGYYSRLTAPKYAWLNIGEGEGQM